MRRSLPDLFRAYKCLDDFDLYASDEHVIAAANHDKAAPRKCPTQSKTLSRIAAFIATKYATGYLYSLCLRSHYMTHLTVSDQVERKKEHDMRTLKRQDILSLRPGGGKGRKVLYIWDRASIDFRQ